MNAPLKFLLGCVLTTATAMAAPTNLVPTGSGGQLAWQPVTSFNDDPAQVSTAGTHHAAIRFGSTDLIVNGVTFSRHTGGGSFANGSPITTTAPSVASLGTGGTGNYGALVSTGGFHNNTSSPNMTLTGLTVGRRYQVQLIMPYWDTLWTTQFGAAGGSSVVVSTGKAGILSPSVCTGNFRATASSQVITWSRVPPNSFALLAAVSVRLMPDESVMTIAENNAPGATVDTLLAVDANAGSTHTFSLVSGAGSADNASFSIVGNTVKINPVADFETKSSYSIRVQADDGSGGVFSKALTVNILNVVEVPEIVVEQPAATNLTSGTASIAFGSVALGAPGAAKTFTIRNTGNGNLTLSNPTVSGGQAGDFTVSTAGLLLTVPPGGQTTFAVTFNPGNSGTRSTTLSIGSNDADESSFTIALTGTGTGTPTTELSVELNGTDLTSRVAAWGRNDNGQTTVPAGLKDVVAVAAGHEHTLALKKDGTVVAWGSNAHGQCDVPVGLPAVKMIAAARWHSLALTTAGNVVMWGDDNEGAFAVPAGLIGVTAISAGGDHTLALLSDGTVTGWGDNSDGELNIPAGLSGVIAIAAGEHHSLALRGSDQKVIAWGFNGNGQSTVPTNLNLVTFIDASGNQSYALNNGGVVNAWGDNTQGQITPPSGLSGVTFIDGGLWHALAKKSDGSLVAWGSNLHGQGTIPSGVGTMTRIACGEDHNAAVGIASPIAFDTQQRGIASATKTITLRNAGTAALTISSVTANGGNAADFNVDLTGMAGTLAPGGSTTFKVSSTPSALGDRSTTLTIVNSDSDEFLTKIPLTVTGIPKVPALINPMYAHVTANTVKLGANVISDDGEAITERGVVLSVTASNNNPKIGDPGVLKIPFTGALGAFWMNLDSLAASTNYTFRVYATNSSGTTYTNARTFATPASKGRIEMISTDGKPYGGTVTTWGDHSFGQLSGSPADSNIIAITSGAVHSVALLRDGTVRAWGDNSFAGQTNVPAGLNNVTAISAGAYFTLALKSDGTVVRWGKESNAGLTPPAGLGGVIAIAAGDEHGLALKNDGTVVQWPSSAGMPANLSGVVGIAAGLGHSLAVLGDGTVVGWGSNYVGQATPLAGLVDVVAVAARGTSSLAMQSNGYIAAWGGNSAIPPGVMNVAGLGTGDGASMVFTRTGGFIGWGDNTDGKITPPNGLSHVIGIAGGSYHTVAMRRELPFGSMGLGSTSNTISFSIRNRGDNELALNQIITVGDNPADFLITSSPGSPSLAAGQDRVVQVSFSPLATGLRTAVLRVKTNDPETPDFDILLSGTGVLEAPLVSNPTVTNLAHHSAVLGATVDQDRGSAVTRRGVVLSLSSRNANPVIGETGVMTLVTSGTLGAFTLPASSLLMNREYAMRGFATNAVGTSYTGVVTFTTPQTALPDIQIEQSAGTPVSGPVVGRGDYGWIPPVPGIVAISSGAYFSLALTQEGKVIGWGDDTSTIFPEEMTDVIAVSAGSGHALALNRDGVVFGSGGYFEFQNTVPASIGNDVVAIHAGAVHNMVLHRNGTVSCWDGGWNGPGGGDWLTPPAGLANVVAITAGGGFCAALKADGTVVTWANALGQPVMQHPPGLNNITAISGGLTHMLALKSDGTVLAWGNNQAGQTNVPEGLSDVVGIFAANDYSLARRSDGTIVAWGEAYAPKLAIPSDHPGYQFVSGGLYHTFTIDTMIDFGPASLGSTTTSKTFTLRNTGDAALHLAGVSIVGANASDFSVTAPATTTLAPAATTTVTVTFSPGATGHRGASLRILSDDFDEGSFDVTLKGNGVIGLPNVLTQPATNLTTSSVTLGGNVTGNGGDAITGRGIVYAAAAANGDPLIGGAGVTRLDSSGTLGIFNFNVSGLTPGTPYVFKAYATNGFGTFYGNSITFSTSTTYPLWAASRFGSATTGTGPEDDFDRDGIQNLMEYALGLNPTQSSQLPVGQELAAGGYLRLTVSRAGLSNGILYRVEASSDLLNWSSANLVVDEETPTRLTVRDHLPASSTPQRFMRLHVELTQQSQ